MFNIVQCDEYIQKDRVRRRDGGRTDGRRQTIFWRAAYSSRARGNCNVPESISG